PEGNRHNVLRDAGNTLAGQIHHGYFSEQEARDALSTAAKRAGLPQAEIDALVDDCMAWGKARPLPWPNNLETPLKREGEGTDKGRRKSQREPTAPEPSDEDYDALSDEDLGIIPLLSVECRPVRWLWKYRLSMGGMALMAGDGGIGKSQV